MSAVETDWAGLTRPLLAAKSLGWTEVFAAERLGKLLGEPDPWVLLALALAVRAPRQGPTGIVLDPEAFRRLPGAKGLSPPADWRARVARSPLVAAPPRVAPLTWTGDLLQTRRYADYEESLANSLRARAAAGPRAIDAEALRADLDRLFPSRDPGDLQRLAVALTVLNPVAVITGGPGTGKTTTVRKLLVALRGQALALGRGEPRVALAAPTGKAAARLRASLREATTHLPEEAAFLERSPAFTLHRLLGFQPAQPTRFRHSREQPLPFDVVVVDEASMVDVALLAKLVDAVPPQSQLVLLGDRFQLASVEAGNVLADLSVQAGRTRPRLPPAWAEQLERVLGPSPLVVPEAEAPPLAAGMVHFQRAYRFEEPALRAPIEALAQASEQGAPGDVRALAPVLAGLPATDRGPVQRRSLVDADLPAAWVQAWIEPWVEAFRPLVAEPDDPARRLAAVQAMDQLRLLTPHRSGPLGVEDLNRRVERALAARLGWSAADRERGLVTGRLVLIVRNDPETQLWNGEVGLTVVGERGVEVLFEAEGPAPFRAVPQASLPRHEPAFALTIHKSQGSQFGHVVVVLPAHPSPLLTRELIYTGISRARRRLTLVAEESVLWDGLKRQVQRATGMAARLEGA